MFSRTISNASFIAFKTVQRQGQTRLLNASAVSLREKNVMDQAKEGAQNLVDKAKETIQHAKEQVGANNMVGKASETIQNAKESVVNAAKSVSSGNLAEKASEAMEHAKDKVQSMASNVSQKGVSGVASDAFQQVKHKVQDAKSSVMGNKSVTTPSATGKSSTYDPRGTQEHVEELIQVNKQHFKEVDKKLGGTGESKGGFDPKTH